MSYDAEPDYDYFKKYDLVDKYCPKLSKSNEQLMELSQPIAINWNGNQCKARTTRIPKRLFWWGALYSATLIPISFWHWSQICHWGKSEWCVKYSLQFNLPCWSADNSRWIKWLCQPVARTCFCSGHIINLWQAHHSGQNKRAQCRCLQHMSEIKRR